MAKNEKITGKIVAIGSGVAAVGAGLYYFLGPKGKQHQKKVKFLATKLAKAEKEIEKEWLGLKEKAKPAIKQVRRTAKKVVKNYRKIKS